MVPHWNFINTSPKNTQIKQQSRTHTLTGFLTSRSPPIHYTTRQANRILIIRNGNITDIRRNLKQEKWQADWILHQNSEIVICFPNRQEFVNYCTTHGHQHFGPQASFFLPHTATTMDNYHRKNIKQRQRPIIRFRLRQ